MESFEGCRNGFSNKDVATKYGAPRKTLSTWAKNKLKLTSSLKKKGNELFTKNYALRELRKGRLGNIQLEMILGLFL